MLQAPWRTAPNPVGLPACPPPPARPPACPGPPRYGVELAHYDIVLNALMTTLVDAMGPALDASAKSGWTKVRGSLADTWTRWHGGYLRVSPGPALSSWAPPVPAGRCGARRGAKKRAVHLSPAGL